ncbi:hypothetical protein NEMIN01_2081, partial [Nematocida minor]|uniref:uncharacterized protein n=1 Tax=Nematocida minor TaxID=1912983 RepID=UPI00221E91D7
MKMQDIHNKSLPLSDRIDTIYNWRATEFFLQHIQDTKTIESEIIPLLHEGLSGTQEDKRKTMSVLIRIRVSSSIPADLIDRLIDTLENETLTNISLAVRCLIEITKKTKPSPQQHARIISSLTSFFTNLTGSLYSSENANETRKSLLLSSEPVILLLFLTQIAKEEFIQNAVPLANALSSFALFFTQRTDLISFYLINENIKLQCITTLTQIISLFMTILKENSPEITAISAFIPELSIFLLGYCPDDAISIKKDIYHHLSILKTEKKRVFASYSEVILKDGILLRPKNPVLKLLGLTLSTEFLIMFRDTTHRHLSLKVCREAAKILCESSDHTLNKLCANVLVQINDTTISDNISIGEKGFFIRMNYTTFVRAFRQYSKIEVTEETKNVLRSIIRGMKNTMHYFSLFQNIPSNAIVFSLKCFSPYEVQELSDNLGLAFRPFNHFDLEKRSDIIIVCEFLLIFFYLDASLFERILLDNVGILFESTKKNKDMFIIWRQFLAYAGVARKFAGVVLQELLKIVHSVEDKEFIVLAFREVFTSFAVHTVEIESVVAGSLQEIFKKCLMTEEKYLYTLEIVKDLFKTAGKEKLDLLHKEMALALPSFFEKMEEIARLHPNCTDVVEIALSVPVKISGLLPFLGQMSKSLLRALQIRGKLGGLAMETLETCVDNLNSEFLMTYLGDDIDAIFTALVDLVQEEESSVMSIKLLGKLSGKASTAFVGNNRSSHPNTDITIIIPGKTDKIKIPLHDILQEASRILSGQKTGSTEQALALVGHYFHSFFRWSDLTDEILAAWTEDIEGIKEADFQELHSRVRAGAFNPLEDVDGWTVDYPSSSIPCLLVSSLFSCAADPEMMKPPAPIPNTVALPSAANPIVNTVTAGSSRGTNSSEGTENEAEISPQAAEAKRLLITLYSFLSVFKALELMHFDDFQRRVRVDVFLLISALTRAFGRPSTESVAQSVLSTMHDISRRICGSREKTSQMTLFYNILHAFCSACYAYSDEEKLCGIRGIIFMTQSLDLGTSWLLYQEIRIVKALFSALSSLRYNNVEAVREGIFHICRTTHDPAVETEPTSSEHFMQLILTFAQELSHPLESVRLVARECLDYSAGLFGSDVSAFLLPIREKVLAQVLSKPLRALPPGVQIGNMEVMTYLFGLRPPLMMLIDERIERFIGEAFRIIASPNGTVVLKQAAVRLFVAAASSPEFTAAPSLIKISQVLIKGLFSKEPEICEVCRDGLRQMYFLGRQPDREVLQSWLVPIVNTIGQKKAVDSVIAGIVHLQELDREIFKTGLCSSLLDLLAQSADSLSESTVDMIFEIFARTPHIPEGEFLTRSVLAYLHHFKNVQPKRRRGVSQYLAVRPLSASFLFRLANEDDTAYYILHRHLVENDAGGNRVHPLAVSGQSSWRQYVLSDAAGESFAGEAIERMLSLWREGAGDAAFGKVVRKWCFQSAQGLIEYFTAEELRTAPVLLPEDVSPDVVRSLFVQSLETGLILSADGKVQKRILFSVESLLSDKSMLCVDGPPEWKISVAMLLIREKEPPAPPAESAAKSKRSPRPTRSASVARGYSGNSSPVMGESKQEVKSREKIRARISGYLQRVLEMEDLEPVDAVCITAFLVEYNPEASTDGFLPLITTHPEYAEHAIRGIVSLLNRHGVEPFIESISSALEDETLYRTHLYILLPAIARVPQLFTGSGIEPSVCTMIQRLFASGSARIALLLLQASIVWYKAGTICDGVALILTKSYAAYYIHTKSGEVVEGISALPFSEDPVPTVPEKIQPQSVAKLYEEAARGNKSLAVSLRPAVRACISETGTEALEAILPVAAKIDRECVSDVFHGLNVARIKPKLAISCATLLGGEETAEKALRLLEEGLKEGAESLTDAVSAGMKLALKYPSPESLTLLAQILSRHPEVFRCPETAEGVVSIVQSISVSSSLKQSVLLAMDSEEFQEIRLGLVHTAYVDPQMHREEIAAGLQPLFVKGLSCASERIRSDFFKVFNEGVSSAPGERLLYLCSFEWELFEMGGWVPAFCRMILELFDVSSMHTDVFWDVSGLTLLENNLSNGRTKNEEPKKKRKNSSQEESSAHTDDADSTKYNEDGSDASEGYSHMLPALFSEFRRYKVSRATIKNSILSLLHGNDVASSQIIRSLLPGVISHIPDKAKHSLHSRIEEMLIRLGKAGTPRISETAESFVVGMASICSRASSYAAVPNASDTS